VSTAFFPDERLEADAREELEGEFDIVPNFTLANPAAPAVPRPVAPPDAPGGPEWPLSGVAQARDRGIRGQGVLVGVLDTGIDADHAEFRRRAIPFRHISLFPNSPFWPPRDVRGFDPAGHGTHVCGTLGGSGLGIAPAARLHVASVIESETTRTSLARVAYGLDWMLREFSRPAHRGRPAVLNLSVGFPATDPGVPPAEMRKRLEALRRMLATLAEANVLPVVAVGNGGPGQCGYPAAFDEVLAVGAVDFDLNRASFSGSGDGLPGRPKPDLVGYGVGIRSASERDFRGRSQYTCREGTSMAAPYVSGIAALYRSWKPHLSVSETIRLLTDTALPCGPSTGAGLARFVP
jgi:subtilisin family serine protease